MINKNEAMKKKMAGKTYQKNPIQGTKFTIAVSSAKGGVGKSTFATNIALALKKIGCKVGLLDADIYGPSLPKLFSINSKPVPFANSLNSFSLPLFLVAKTICIFILKVDKLLNCQVNWTKQKKNHSLVLLS